MKKSVFILVLLILFASLVSAININMQETYKPGETLIASIEGNFISPLIVEQVYFYDGRVEVPLIYDLGKIQDKYYLYALLPVKERNYTLVIKKAHYFENAIEHKEDIRKNFSVQGNLTDFSVSPGFIITRNDFEIRVESLNDPLKIKTDFLGEKQEVDVLAAQSKKIYFFTKDIKNFTFTEITISSDKTAYKIPAAISTTGENITFKTNKFRFNPAQLNSTIKTKSDWVFDIFLVNLGDNDIENIKLEHNLDDVLEISPDNIDLKAGSSEKIQLKFNIDKEETVEGYVEAVSGNLSAKILMIISAKEKAEEVNNSANPIYYTCSELNGKICLLNETCDGYSQTTGEGNCCTGTCKQEQKSDLTNIIWIIVIIIVIAAILFFVLKKLKIRKKTSKEFLKEKEEKYEERFIKKGIETKGSLTKD